MDAFRDYFVRSSRNLNLFFLVGMLMTISVMAPSIITAGNKIEQYDPKIGKPTVDAGRKVEKYDPKKGKATIETFQLQTVREVKLHFVTTYSSGVTRQIIQDTLNNVNAIHYRSDSEVRFIIDENTDLNKVESWDDIWEKIQNGEYAPFIENSYGAVPVIIREVGGNNSSCFPGASIFMRNMSSFVNFGHESNHYLCVGHTHPGFPGLKYIYKKDAANIIKTYLQQNPSVDPNNKDYILRETFDGDLHGSPNSAYPEIAYLSNYPIEDTPPDAGNDIFAEEYGEEPAWCNIYNKNVDIDVDYMGSPYTFILEPDRRNISSYFKTCYPGYMNISPQQVKKLHAAIERHRSKVTTFRRVPTWSNSIDVRIPPAEYVHPKPAISYIQVEGSGSVINLVDEITIGVDIVHPRGGLHIELWSPDNDIYILQEPNENSNVPGFLLSGGIKTLFFKKAINGNARRNGLWQLRVWEDTLLKKPGDAPPAAGPKGEGYINSWQLQF